MGGRVNTEAPAGGRADGLANMWTADQPGGTRRAGIGCNAPIIVISRRFFFMSSTDHQLVAAVIRCVIGSQCNRL